MKKTLRVLCAILSVSGFAIATASDRQVATAGAGIGIWFAILFALLFVKRVF
jgi:hypothetical protein